MAAPWWIEPPVPVAPPKRPPVPPAPTGASVLWVASTAAAWVALTSAHLATSPPQVPLARWATAICALGAASLLIAAALLDRHLLWWRRWGFVAVAANATVALIVSRFVWTAFAGWITIGTVLWTFPVVVTTVLTSLLVRRTPVAARITCVAVGVLFAAVWWLGVPGPMPALALRLHLGAGARLETEARQNLTDPPPDSGSVFVAESEDPADGGRVVAFRMVDGIPATSWGLVYAPDGPIETWKAGDSKPWIVSRCRPVTGPWWWCRVY